MKTPLPDALAGHLACPPTGARTLSLSPPETNAAVASTVPDTRPVGLPTPSSVEILGYLPEFGIVAIITLRQ